MGTSTPAGLPDPGKLPEARWIEKRLLTIEPVYQRAVSSKRGQALIEKLASNWFWAHASVLVVAPRGEGWTIIDGQHRHQAAMRRPDIEKLLCVIVDAPLLKHQARAFIAHNRDRVTLNFLALFHATLAAGDENCQKVIEACAAAGVTICRTSKTVEFLKPDETMAVGAMLEIVKADGPEHLVRVLNLIRSAYPNKHGQLRSNTMKAVCAVLHAGAGDDDLRAVLKKTDGIGLEDAARALRKDGNSIIQGFIITLGRACGLEIENKKIVRKPGRPRADPEAAPAIGAKVALRPDGDMKRATRHAAAGGKPKPYGGPKPAKAPFTFDKSKPTAAQIRADKKLHASRIPSPSTEGVEVRRFEAGSQDRLIEKALSELGLTMKRTANRAQPYTIGTRKFSHASLIDFIDAHRKKRGLLPIRKK